MPSDVNVTSASALSHRNVTIGTGVSRQPDVEDQRAEREHEDHLEHVDDDDPADLACEVRRLRHRRAVEALQRAVASARRVSRSTAPGTRRRRGPTRSSQRSGTGRTRRAGAASAHGRASARVSSSTNGRITVKVSVRRSRKVSSSSMRTRRRQARDERAHRTGSSSSPTRLQVDVLERRAGAPRARSSSPCVACSSAMSAVGRRRLALHGDAVGRAIARSPSRPSRSPSSSGAASATTRPWFTTITRSASASASSM